MDKLTIKEIAPYIPYGLKCQIDKKFTKYSPIRVVEIKGLSRAEPENKIEEQIEFVIEDGSDIDFRNMEDVTLLLRPLSDLTKEIEHNGERFVPMVELLKIKHKRWFVEKLNSRYSEIDHETTSNYAKAHFRFMATYSIEVWFQNIENEEYWVIQKLLEWHFDCFNLIERGLAVDLNTVE